MRLTDLSENARPDMGDLSRWEDYVSKFGGYLDVIDAAKGIYDISSKTLDDAPEKETTRRFQVRDPRKTATALFIGLSKMEDIEAAKFEDMGVKISFLNKIRDRYISPRTVNVIRNAAGTKY